MSDFNSSVFNSKVTFDGAVNRLWDKLSDYVDPDKARAFRKTIGGSTVWDTYDFLKAQVRDMAAADDDLTACIGVVSPAYYGTKDFKDVVAKYRDAINDKFDGILGADPVPTWGMY